MAKVLFINAKEQKVEVREVSTLQEQQALVEGYIEPVYYVKNLKRSLLCVNEEGLYKGFDYGFELDGHQFVGNGFIGTLAKSDTKVAPADLVGRLAWFHK